MKKFKGLSFIVCLAVFWAAGSAWAWNATDHVSVAPNGKGDALIFPTYFTGSGWTTTFTVVNTSTTHSVVAKVVFRSAHRSQELLDFMIYLTPTDVWTGRVYQGDDGRPWVFSDDDSAFPGRISGGFASVDDPLLLMLQDACAGDTNELGYVEVIQGASWQLGAPPVQKADLRAAYRQWLASQTDATIISDARMPVNSLVGYQEINNSIFPQSYGLNAYALKDYDSLEFMSVATESQLGLRGIKTNVVEVEAALAKNNVAIPYKAAPKGFTFSTFTFPTKNAGFPCGVDRWEGEYSGFPSPLYVMSVYDLQENAREVTHPEVSPQPIQRPDNFPQELNFIFTGALAEEFPFDEGWYNVRFLSDRTPAFGSIFAADRTTSLSYTGAPVIVTTMRFGADGRGGWTYAPHDLGRVTVNGTVDLQYNYWGQEDINILHRDARNTYF